MSIAPKAFNKTAEPAEITFDDIYQKTSSGFGMCKPGDPKSDCNFKPDYSFGTSGAREWGREAHEQNKKPLDVDDDGKHNVRRGDTMWGIAERSLRRDDHQATDKEIQKRIEEIVQLNKKNYPALECNPDMIRPGYKLQIPGEGDAEPKDNPSSPDSGAKETPSNPKQADPDSNTEKTPNDTTRGSDDTSTNLLGPDTSTNLLNPSPSDRYEPRSSDGCEIPDQAWLSSIGNYEPGETDSVDQQNKQPGKRNKQPF